MLKGFHEIEVEMKNGFEEEFANALNESKEIGPIKYGKTYKASRF